MIFRTKNRQINIQNLNVYIDFNEPNSLVVRPELKVNLQRVYNEGDRENQSYKLLGIIFDEYLSFDKHVVYVQRKIARSLFLLNRSKNFLTFRAWLMLYYATVHSHLLYCPIILSIASKTNINRIATMQKKAIRIVYLTDHHEHTANLFYDAKILPLSYLIKHAKLLFMHTIKYDFCPKSFRDVFTRTITDNPVYNLRYPNDFDLPRPRIELFKCMPIYTLPQEWNECEELRFYQNPVTFKIALTETLFHIFALENNLFGGQY
jgi:hypothetical protein